MLLSDDQIRHLESSDFVVETQERVLATSLRALNQVVGVTRLTPQPAGDVMLYVADEIWGVERKSAADLLASYAGSRMRCMATCALCGGRGCQRLTSQMRRMLDNYDHVVLFIEGWFGATECDYIQTAYRTHQLLWHGLMNTLSKWQHAGVELQFSADVQHTAACLISLRDYWQSKS